MEHFVIDTDPGVDDAHAIMMALAHPGVTVDALTIVAGNVGLERTVANACTIIDVLQADVAVYAGCDGPLVLPSDDAAHVHGPDGLGNAGYPPSERTVEREHASQALVRLANEAPGERTLVALGPLTNIAVALKLDPALANKYKKLVVMGGAIRSMGNTRNLSAEFNIYADPEAAHIVFERWPGFNLVSWETTMAYGFHEDILQTWLMLETPRARFFRDITSETIEYVRSLLGRSMLYGADPLAMAVALEPDIVTKAEQHFVTVELHGRHTRGQTTVDWFDRSGQPCNGTIVLEVLHERFLQLMELALQ